MELQVGVKAFLRNKDGKFLVVRRSARKYAEIGDRWDIPGGRIDPGQELMENLKREIREEVDLDLKEEPRLIAAQDILRVPGRHVVRLTYSGTIDGEPHPDGEENTEFRWLTLEELNGLEHFDIYAKELLDKKIIR
jgi:8-oxo-dGTP diphosphatase